MPRVRTDQDDFDLPERPKRKLDKDPHAAFEAKVRDFVLRTPEDWLTSKWIAAKLHGGASHVGRVLAAMAEEGILSPLRRVPQSEDERVKVHATTVGRGVATPWDVTAYAFDGRWVIGYYDVSTGNPRKKSLFHGKPDPWKRPARIRGRTYQRRLTKKEILERLRGYEYKDANWDGRAHAVLRNGSPYINACLAAGIEPMTDLPWICPECNRKNEAANHRCDKYQCDGEKPRLLQGPEPRVCDLCGEPDVDGHSRRHAVRKTAKMARSKQKCLGKMVDAVHKM